MTTHCPYCGEDVPDDDYEPHLRRAHRAELSAIDRRRVGLAGDGSNGRASGRRRQRRRTAVLYAGVGVVLVVVVLGYATLFLGGDEPTGTAAVQPDTGAPIHEHGTITVQYDETAVDFDDPRYLERDGCFHFHGADDAAVWHTHCADVTIEYALETLGMELTVERFAVGDEEFTTDDGDTITVTANGDPVDPQTHVLEGVESVDDASAGAGDHVEVVVESGDGGGSA